MEKTDIFLILLSFGLIFYLLIQLNVQPLEINSEINREIETLSENTPIQISGLASNINKYSQETVFNINSTTIRAKTRENIKPRGVAVLGLIKKYKNSTYIQAIKIEYVT